MIIRFALSYLLLIQHSKLKLFEDSMEHSWFGKLNDKENPAGFSRGFIDANERTLTHSEAEELLLL